jgi:hypothetical protein
MHHEVEYNIYYAVQHLRLTYDINLKLNRDIKGQKSFYCVVSPPVFSGVPVTRSLVLYISFVDRCFSFCTFSFGHGLVVLLRYTDSDYPFGISKLFLTCPQEP